MPTAATPRPGPIFRLRKRVRRWVEPYPWLYRGLLKLWGLAFGARFFIYALTSGRLRHRPDAAALAAFIGRQRLRTFQVELGAAADVDGLRAALKARGLDPAEGGWTFYLPPGDALARLCPFLASHYPPGVGLKLLKDMRAPAEARYTPHDQNPAAGASLLRKLTPSPLALLRVAEALHRLGLGPKVWDLVHLRSGGTDLSAYVVAPVDGGPPDAAQYADFMDRLRPVLDDGLVATAHPSVAMSDDFAAPDGNGNLRVDPATGKALFVDFQSFVIPDEGRLLSSLAEVGRAATHFGAGRFFRGGGDYLYQAIPGLEPGKRDPEQRWRTVHELLDGAGVGFEDRPVFDIGCNTGLMLYQALGAGARWACGWDMPEVAASAARLLGALGATRTTLTGGAISPDSDFATAVPAWAGEGGVLFYLAVSDHIGFPEGVAALPWRHMLYEGHADQGVGDQVERLRQVRWLKDAKLLGHRMAADGDSPPRPLLLLQR
ncbi:MAG: hypothetical protein RIM84_01260 [Alphaproteobacteria bacterium]